MANEFALDRETMNELEEFSVELENLREVTEVINYFVWQRVIENCRGEEIESVRKIGALTQILSKLVGVHEHEFDKIIQKITPLHNPVED